MNDKEFSQENANLEIIKNETKDVDAVVFNHDGLDVKKGGNVIIGTLNIMMRPFKNRHKKHYKNSNFHLIADVVLGLAVLILGAWLIWIKFFYVPIHELSVEIKSLNSEIVSGRDETFEVYYKNEKQKTINEVSLAMNFPENFVLKKTIPDNIYDKNTNHFNIGSVPVGANGRFKIVGTIYGEVGAQQIISSVMSYKNGVNGRTDASFLTSLIYTIEDSALKTELVLPEHVYKNTDFEGKVILRNTGVSEMKNIILEPLTDKFSIKESSCEINKQGLLVVSLNSGQIKEIIFTAQSNNLGQQVFGFKPYIENENIKIPQTALEKNIEVIIPKFEVTIESDKNSIYSDDKVNFVIKYKNNESFDIGNVSMALGLEGANFALSNLEITGANSCTLKNNIISVNKVLSAGEGGSIRVGTKIKVVKTALNNSTNLNVKSSYQLNSQEVSYSVASKKIKLISNLQTKATARYYSQQGDQLGAGPLPPVVDIPTNYWIFFDVDNFGNDLSDYTLTAELPANVYYLGNKTVLSGDLQVAEISKRVVWTIKDIEKNNAHKRAGFEVALIPEKTDVGKVVNLLANIRVSSQDNFANFTIKGSINNLNSDLKDDIFAAQKGRVKAID